MATSAVPASVDYIPYQIQSNNVNALLEPPGSISGPITNNNIDCYIIDNKINYFSVAEQMQKVKTPTTGAMYNETPHVDTTPPKSLNKKNNATNDKKNITSNGSNHKMTQISGWLITINRENDDNPTRFCTLGRNRPFLYENFKNFLQTPDIENEKYKKLLDNIALVSNNYIFIM